MINQKQRMRMVQKLSRLCTMTDSLFFTAVRTLNASCYETNERLYTVPAASCFAPISKGAFWGKEHGFAWFSSSITIDSALVGKALFVRPRLGGYEGLLYVNGNPHGAFAEKIAVTSHGNHYCCCVEGSPEQGQTLALALEYYAGHHVPGTQPFDTGNGHCFHYAFEGIELCHKNQLAIDFATDLRILLEIYEFAVGHTYRKAEIYYLLEELHKDAPYSADALANIKIWKPFFESALAKMKPILAKAACESDGKLTFIGHSHMDTAWLWQREETIKKCARTTANALNYIKQYPEYRFLQSSTYHYEIIKRHYPYLYAQVKQMIAAERFEPNGGCFIECDCNITGGEFIVRQFLWAQRFTREEFGYTADCFWLPDTFGYAASIPQIMQGCGLKYFLTTKLSWNDTNQFPYESFWWEGIDGTRVLTHFNITQNGPYPAHTIAAMRPREDVFQSGERFFAFGEGDGGGGPEFCMIEAARRSQNVLGAPKGEYGSLSSFMNKLSQNEHLPRFKGELYLELHRATLTNQPRIKRNNRKAELLHRNVELVQCMQALLSGKQADITDSNIILRTILINQFHDILPGTCIQAAHEDCYQDMEQAINALQASLSLALGKGDIQDNAVTVFNPLCSARQDVIPLTLPSHAVPAGLQWQLLAQTAQSNIVLVDGVQLSAFGTATIPLTNFKESSSPSPFIYTAKKLETPYYTVSFNANGYIEQLYHKQSGRFLAVQDKHPLGAIASCESVPLMWDSWDIDADTQMRLKLCTSQISSDIVSSGCVAHVYENVYEIAPQATVAVRTTFYAEHPNIEFETTINTQASNLFICTQFNLALHAPTARFDIQYGNVQRPTTQNTSTEQAAFEVCHHKFVDLSEHGYGVALLNNCKYGAQVKDSCIQLSLHYGAQHPDPSASKGCHTMKYVLLPHVSGFDAVNVVLPAYRLNQPMLLCAKQAALLPVPFTHDSLNIIAEAIKPSEATEHSIIVRLYECEGRQAKCTFSLNSAMQAVFITNMLEEVLTALPVLNHTCIVSFKPYEIITLKLCYRSTSEVIAT